MAFLSKIFRRIAYINNRVADYLESKHDEDYRIEVSKWYRDNGDLTHRLNYNLIQQSLVVDLGGYEGQWASDIFSKYLCKVMIFEPYSIYARSIKNRFRHNSNIQIFSFGLSNADKTEKLSINNNASSMCKEGKIFEMIELKQAASFFCEAGIKQIDLIKINIEGAEYELLEHLIETEFVKNIQNIQVQFHSFVLNAQQRMNNIQDSLQKTHKVTYRYDFVWENWERTG